MKILLFWLLLWAVSCKGAIMHVKASGDYMTATSAALANAWLNNTNAVSISIWVKFQSLDAGDTQEIIAKAQPAFAGQSIFDIRNSLQKFDFYYYNPDNTFQFWETTATWAQTNSWMHLGLTFTFGTGSSLRFYVNGVSVPGAWGAGTGNVLGITNAVAFHIASNEPSGSPYLNGLTSEAAIWHGILTSSEMATLALGKMADAPYQIRPDILVFYMPMNDATDGKTASSRGNVTTDRGPHRIDMDVGGKFATEKAVSYPPNE